MNPAYNFKVTFLSKEKLTIVKVEGKITLKDVISTIDSIQLHPNYKSDYSFLVDVRSAEFFNEINIVKAYYVYVNRKYPHILEEETVWLASKANQVVMVTLFKLLLGKLQRNSSVVSTVDYALSKFKPSNKVYIKQILESFHNQDEPEYY
ncbi:hypothetical protein [Saccharicrinis aurantiacus]|uniref:hypothetical protein n=1 Tax=Saccharicrinis aurantiacus TaxID=1849719 RepID=UPI002493C44B|nr:hypothetical protein [Saccharicrinis aurantiacus]